LQTDPFREIVGGADAFHLITKGRDAGQHDLVDQPEYDDKDDEAHENAADSKESLELGGFAQAHSW